MPSTCRCTGARGSGLTTAEATLLGKPVVATRCSGNLDSMDDDDGIPIDCEVMPVRRIVPSYTVPGAAGRSRASPRRRS